MPRRRSGSVSVAPLSFVPTQTDAASPRVSYTVRVIVPPGVTCRFTRPIESSPVSDWS